MITDRYRAELVAAGWRYDEGAWKSPKGKCYPTAYGAWRAMKITRGWAEKNKEQDQTA